MFNRKVESYSKLLGKNRRVLILNTYHKADDANESRIKPSPSRYMTLPEQETIGKYFTGNRKTEQ